MSACAGGTWQRTGVGAVARPTTVLCTTLALVALLFSIDKLLTQPLISDVAGLAFGASITALATVFAALLGPCPPHDDCGLARLVQRRRSKRFYELRISVRWHTRNQVFLDLAWSFGEVKKASFVEVFGACAAQDSDDIEFESRRTAGNQLLCRQSTAATRGSAQCYQVPRATRRRRSPPRVAAYPACARAPRRLTSGS
jgi:hypothetical protein